MKAAALIAAFLATAGAQDLRERSLEMEKQRMDAERREREQQRPDLSKPVEKKRNAKDCENARVTYQTSCGSPIAPKYRSPACRDAEIYIRQAC